MKKKFLKSPYKIQCQHCKKFTNKIIQVNEQFLCLECSNKIIEKMSNKELKNIDKSFKVKRKLSPGKKIYAIDGIKKIFRG